MGEFRMPSLGADMDAGTLVEWRVKPGDAVKRGEVVAVVETDKGIVDVEMWEAGVIDSLVVTPGKKVPVGTVLATTRTTEEVAGPAEPKPAAPVEGAQPSRVRASPAARQLARERGIELTAIHGTGPHDAVTREDVEHAPTRSAPPAAPQATAAPAPPRAAAALAPAASAAAPPAAAAPSLDAGAMRRAIAAAMTRSKKEIPHYYLSSDVDALAARSWLEAENAHRPVTERLLFAAVLLKATALAVREVPEMNGFFVDGDFRGSKAVHLGVAISLRQGGLVAPAIHDVDRQSLLQIQAALHDLVARVRAGRLRSSEMTDPTLTVTNLGDQGAQSVFGVIYPPQVALVGFGRVAERVWASSGMIGVRPVVTVTLSADHRASDGHRGAAFLAAIDRRLQKPEDL
jgi:pyruvate dehydrogenase E2 component (dihydrolipoamide acetyltransferase)